MTFTIRTKYRGPTDVGARIVARGLGRQITVPFDHSASDPHAVAARALAAKVGANVDSLTLVDGTPGAKVWSVEVGK